MSENYFLGLLPYCFSVSFKVIRNDFFKNLCPLMPNNAQTSFIAITLIPTLHSVKEQNLPALHGQLLLVGKNVLLHKELRGHLCSQEQAAIGLLCSHMSCKLTLVWPHIRQTLAARLLFWLFYYVVLWRPAGVCGTPLDEGILLLPDEPLSLLADRKFSRHSSVWRVLG